MLTFWLLLAITTLVNSKLNWIKFSWLVEFELFIDQISKNVFYHQSTMFVSYSGTLFLNYSEESQHATPERMPPVCLSWANSGPLRPQVYSVAHNQWATGGSWPQIGQTAAGGPLLVTAPVGYQWQLNSFGCSLVACESLPPMSQPLNKSMLTQCHNDT